MSNSQSSGFVRFFNGLTFARNLILNIFFFLVVAIFLGALLFKGEKTFNVEQGSTLYLNLNAKIVEEHTKAPLERAFAEATGNSSRPEIRLYDLLRVLKTAKNDSRISQVFLDVDGFSAGLAQIREISQAIMDIRQSGKKVYAFAESYDQKQYHVAAAADQVYMDPEGAVALEGISDYRQYFRSLLEDKLGVKVHLFRVGEYKSAAEPYIRDNASSEAKEASLFWMNDLWRRYLVDVGNMRKIDPALLQRNINNSAQEVKSVFGDLGALALKQKLVDKLMTKEQVEDSLKSSGATDASGKDLLAVSFGDYLGDLSFKEKMGKDRIAIVVAQGEIVDGQGDAGSVGGEELSEKIRDVREDDSIKAMVLRVDSPGGAVFASEQIRREVAAVRSAGKPVVVSMGNVAASGGYWISMDADAIYADPSTITGSIGIFGLVPNFSDALSKIGVHTDGGGTTAIAGASDVTKPLGNDLKEIIQQVINNGYTKFITKVSHARHIPINEVDKNARGRVWSGMQAKERKLIDKEGGLQAALIEANRLAKGENMGVVFMEQRVSPFAQFLMNMQASAFGRAFGMDTALLQTFLHAPEAKMIQKAVQNPNKLQSYAHCLCGIP